MSRDNWERLVVAVLKRDQIWQLCHQDSIPTVSSDFSERLLSFSSNHILGHVISSSPSPQLPLTNEYVVNEIHKSRPLLSWAIRLRVALGAARGLNYMHQECERGIIHGEVKAENILVDEEFEAVVGDFGLAKYADRSDDDVGRRGRYGHIAPEYLSFGNYSFKSDVYGYGSFFLLAARRGLDLARLAKGHNMMLLDWVSVLPFNSF